MTLDYARCCSGDGHTSDVLRDVTVRIQLVERRVLYLLYPDQLLGHLLSVYLQRRRYEL